MTQAMKLHGLRDKTIDSCRRTPYRVAGHFDRCPDDLKPEELKEYFSAMLERYSWCTIKLDLSSLKFVHRYVLDREMEWIKIIRPPRVRTLPDSPTREDVQLLINAVRKLRYRIFLLGVYSLGLRIGEDPAREVADIDVRIASAPMDASGVQAALGAAQSECGSEKTLTVQSLRHAYATHLLGHSHSNTAARYAHITQVPPPQTRCLPLRGSV